MLTLEELKEISPGEVFATGILPNSPEGIYRTDFKKGEDLRWIAKKGYGYDDWSIYTHWAYHDVNWIKEQGDKVISKENIQKCVPCDYECINHYRF